MECTDRVAGSMDPSTHSTLLQLRGTDLSAVGRPAVVVCHNMPPFFGYPAPKWRSCEPCPPAGYTPAFTIARAMTEASRVPSDFAAACNSLDEVWTPSQYSRNALVASGVYASKVHVVPPAVNTTLFDAARFPKDEQGDLLASLTLVQAVFGTHHRQRDHDAHIYKFVSVFKWELRKGWDVLLGAYLSEFSAQDPVALYIITKPFTGKDQDIKAEIQRWVAVNLRIQPLAVPRMFLVASHLADEQYARLLAAMDAFVLPTRGEGWCMPAVEAMSSSLPVLATQYSGLADYLDTSVGFPIMFTEVPVPDSINLPWFKGAKWAEPSLQDLQLNMRYVASHPQEGVHRGRAARARITNRYSLEAMGRQLAWEFHRVERTALPRAAAMKAAYGPHMG